MTKELVHDLRCPVCLLEYSSAFIKRAHMKGCPGCNTKLKPLKIKNDGYIKINWQDLRVLAIYAQRWSITFDKSVKGNIDSLEALQNIIEGLRHYKPAGEEPIVPTTDVVSIHFAPFGGYIPVPGSPPQPLFEKDADGLIPSPFYQPPEP